MMLWAGFVLFVVAVLALDLGVFHRRAHVIHMREALIWTGVWIGLALMFNAAILYFWGPKAGLEFLTGYLVEKSLSMDNVFVLLLIFSYFKTPPSFQHKVLFWGILGAIVARTFFIVGGLAILGRFHWTIYVFGSFLLGTGVWMIFNKGQQYDPERNPVIRLFRRYAPVAECYESDRFFIRRAGRLLATPLFIVLLAVESSDIVFAIDSIPAIFSITQDHFIVYTSNIFAMLGLRAMYFAVASFMRSFHYLHYGFASIIIILGIKMLLSDVYHVPVTVAVVLVVIILMGAIIVSLLRPRSEDLKRMLQRSHSLGIMPFRRLLVFENIFRLGHLRVRDAMRPRSRVRALKAEKLWDENHRTLLETRFSRYPLVEGAGEIPLGIVHVKDLFYLDIMPDSREAWKTIARPAFTVREDQSLEDLLMTLKDRRQHLALVLNNAGQWTGLITLEDVLEEIVGRVGDEFEPARYIPFAALTPDRIFLEMEAESLNEAVSRAIARFPASNGAGLRAGLTEAVVSSDRAKPRYLGNGVAIVHAVIDALDQPVSIFVRSDSGVPMDSGEGRASLLFIVLLPPSMVQKEGEIAEGVGSLMESDYLRERLLQADTPETIIQTLREGIDMALD
jgi:tellurite resistance protein TerC